MICYTAAGDHFSEEDMMATEPYVDDHFSHLNKFHNGLVRSAMLNRLVEGKKVPQYRVPSKLGHHKLEAQRTKPVPPACNAVVKSPRSFLGGGSLAGRHRLRVVQTSEQVQAFKSGPTISRRKDVAFRIPQRPRATKNLG